MDVVSPHDDGAGMVRYYTIDGEALMPLTDYYRLSLALLTDLYELTMAYGYWKLGMQERRACFVLHFREHPVHGGFTLACGLADVIDYLQHLRFTPDDLAYLATLAGSDGAPLFTPAFLDYLGAMVFRCDVDAVPEGTVIFPHEPLIRVTGPLWQAQLLESALLNILNFQTLIATKAARICLAARGDPVIEFGLRRAQGVDGSLSGVRAAIAGGCAGTSHTLAGKLFGIPVKGTHAHSWVMAFPDELRAFDAYADVMPHNCILLVDTYDTLRGVRQAIAVAERLRARGQRLLGIRLDSGDLAYLSGEARALLDAAGLRDVFIMGSSELDEYVIDSLKEQDAQIHVWGVGTRLITGGDQAALGGIYKLTAVQDEHGAWRHVLKLSEQVVKITTPGLLQVRRFSDEQGFVADMIYDELLGVEGAHEIVHPGDATRRKHIPAGTVFTDLLAPIFRDGRCVYEPPPLLAVRDRGQAQLRQLHPGIKRFVNPHEYPAGLEPRLHAVKTRLIFDTRRTEQ